MKIIYTNVEGAYPDIQAKNSTSTEAKDGTPLNKDLFDEYFGVLQAATSQGGITPSGSVELHDNSDVMNGIRNIAGSPGEIVWKVNYTSSDAIANGERLLLLNGSTVLVANYPLLVQYAYCGDGFNNGAVGFYRCDNVNGTGRNTAGIYFYLPDYRGYFVRCHGGNDTGLDPSSRPPNTTQSDGIKDHAHEITDKVSTGNTSYAINNTFGSTGTLSPGVGFALIAEDEIFADDSTDTNQYETRPVNRSAYAFVRY